MEKGVPLVSTLPKGMLVKYGKIIILAIQQKLVLDREQKP